jgi:hypothetical protein
VAGAVKRRVATFTNQCVARGPGSARRAFARGETWYAPPSSLTRIVGALDFVVAFADTTPGTYADRYLDLAEALEALFGRKVDLLTERAIRNPYFRREVDATRQVVYDKRGQEAAA